MKKLLAILILSLMIIGCPDPAGDPEDSEDDWECESRTFEKASQSYFDKYGDPEDVNEYTSHDPYYHIIDWWWWSKGFMVSFEWIACVGWEVASTYSFDPI